MGTLHQLVPWAKIACHVTDCDLPPPTKPSLSSIATTAPAAAPSLHIVQPVHSGLLVLVFGFGEQEMLSQYENGVLRMKPTSVAASAVLHACAHTTTSKGQEVRLEAVDIALEVWQDIQELDLLNDFLVTLLLRILGRHVDDYDERFRLATIAFQQACVAGCVSSDVVDALHLYVPTLFKQLPTNKSSNKVELPAHWTRVVNS